MYETPSKLQPIVLEYFDGTADGGTNARVFDEMPMALAKTLTIVPVL